jgi:hypothetical protein
MTRLLVIVVLIRKDLRLVLPVGLKRFSLRTTCKILPRLSFIHR